MNKGSHPFERGMTNVKGSSAAGEIRYQKKQDLEGGNLTRAISRGKKNHYRLQAN